MDLFIFSSAPEEIKDFHVAIVQLKCVLLFTSRFEPRLAHSACAIIDCFVLFAFALFATAAINSCTKAEFNTRLLFHPGYRAPVVLGFACAPTSPSFSSSALLNANRLGASAHAFKTYRKRTSFDNSLSYHNAILFSCHTSYTHLEKLLPYLLK